MVAKKRDDEAGYARLWRAQHGKKYRTYSRDYHNRRKSEPAYRQRKNEASRWTRRKRKYGVTRDQYLQMMAAQGGLCAICGDNVGSGLRVDHDHSTGRIRGLLCSPCNSGLGMFQDDALRLQRAKEYLARNRENVKEIS